MKPDPCATEGFDRWNENQRMIRAEQKLEKARECLEWYADTENAVSINSVTMYCDRTNQTIDSGQRARKCLEEIGR